MSDQSEKKTILFFGDSLAAGFGIDPDLAFPALIQKKIDALGWDFTVVNAGLSGETTAGGVRRIDWVLQRKIDLLFLELGGNDGLRGIDLGSTKANLQKIIDRTRAIYPDVRVVLAGMQIPPNMGPEYIQRFRAIYPEIADENEVALLPFLLKDVGGKKKLNLADGIHPTPEGHNIVAETVWEIMGPVLVEMTQ
ncbi:MAG: arylesterase [Gemmatimonadota bacterium]|nr:arylesterase [Gemmatimonadota bacterium]